MHKTDVLIIGGGVAGMTLAIKIAMQRSDLSITVATKTIKEESNTRYAQGGVASVWDHDVDSYKKHIEDTLDAGDGLCVEEIVRIVVEEGPERVKEIIEWGTRFDKNKAGNYDLGMEGGHSEYRILHYKDLTGAEIQRAINEKAASYSNIKILENFYAINLLTQHHLGRNITRLNNDIECYGAYMMDKDHKEIETWQAKVTVLATGGAGQIYRNTTNPTIATGDGVAMFYRAKGRIANMEFVQFHPTALYNPAGENPDFLVSEAVRGFGAILRTKDGKEFMQKYDDRLSLAPRDIVARAIDNEMKVRGDEYVFLDCTHLDKKGFIAHFPTIHEKCMSLGIDPMKDFIPVVPACHYMCGGILTDEMGRTSIKNLYSAGECTCTGLHGANRLASNSLLEGLVFAHRINEDVQNVIDQISFIDGIPKWDAQGTTEPNEMVLITQSWKELKEIMSSYVGIVRTDVRIKRAMDRLYLLYSETEELYNSSILSPQLCELRNLITIGYLVTKSAQSRKESRGLHFNTDYPDQFEYLETTIM
ncbi:L-aspartate oxidase [Portibacter lacus]|uniref:L-aspartate oxidase n=1 Tax=Portibacter lacus TaxID=1099794 RepID=A0AA37WDA0_9BACT|nr:L-aspartate oxidase [Portibacter lacus]GLR17771.1 L-aspartate oxidase [Portibacter lacus]